MTSTRKERAPMPDMMEWLRAGLPLTLVVDLLDPAGPGSATRYVDEPGDAGWLTAA
jgi:hypothetical protein